MDDGTHVSKTFLQNAVLGEVFLLQRGSLGRSFWRNLGRSFAGIFRAKKDVSKNFSPEFPRLCTAKLAKIQGKLHDDPCQLLGRCRPVGDVSLCDKGSLTWALPQHLPQ